MPVPIVQLLQLARSRRRHWFVTQGAHSGILVGHAALSAAKQLSDKLAVLGCICKSRMETSNLSKCMTYEKMYKQELTSMNWRPDF
jgi:hypothetical protein